MKEFDELLKQVLCEGVNLEPPVGMELRIALALSSDRKRTRNTRRIWLQALAATILLGLAGIWGLYRSQRIVTVVPKAVFVGEQKFIADNTNRPLLPSQASQGSALERASVSGRHPLRQHQRRTFQLAPLKIEPLSIKPIEIASLTSSNSTGKGEVR